MITLYAHFSDATLYYCFAAAQHYKLTHSRKKLKFRITHQTDIYALRNNLLHQLYLQRGSLVVSFSQARIFQQGMIKMSKRQNSSFIMCHDRLIFTPPFEMVLIVNAVGLLRGKELDANDKCTC